MGESYENIIHEEGWQEGFDNGLAVGRREVVECEELVGWYDTSAGKRVFCVPEDYRSGKLKEWGIDGKEFQIT